MEEGAAAEAEGTRVRGAGLATDAAVPLQAASRLPEEAEPQGPKHPAVPASRVTSASPTFPIPPCWQGSACSFHCFGEGGQKQAARPGKRPSRRPRELPETFQLSRLLVRPDKLGAWQIGPTLGPCLPSPPQQLSACPGSSVEESTRGCWGRDRCSRRWVRGLTVLPSPNLPGMGRAEHPGR